MFKKAFRKRLIEQDWLQIKKENKNNPQQWKRIKDMSKRTIKDLTLLSNTLPMEERKEIFDNDIIPLISSISRVYSNEDTEIYKFPNMDLVSSLIKYGLYAVIFKYNLMNKSSPNISLITIEHLERTMAICQDISNIIKDETVEKEAIKNKRAYLFSWDNLKNGENNYKFTRFLKKTIEKIYTHQLVKKDPLQSRMARCDKISYIGPTKLTADIFDRLDDVVVGKVTLFKDIVNSKGRLTIEMGNVRRNEDLILKEIDGKHYFFSK